MRKTVKDKQNNQVREMTYAEAIRDGLDIALSQNPLTFAIGEGIPDPKGAFGTTTGLSDKHGPYRIMDMPVSENGMTGVALGAALGGMRPILTHMRIDFSLLSMDQIINNISKWFFMYGGQVPAPVVIRMIIGRGWGQGPQHSQSLHALFGHIPGLLVVMPASPADAKGLLLGALEQKNPVIYIEHRWLHKIRGDVPVGYYTVPMGVARTVQPGSDISIIATSYMAVEAVKSAKILEKAGVSAEVIDVRSIRPIDIQAITSSVSKTKRLLVADTGYTTLGFGSEVLARVAESGVALVHPPKRVALPDIPTPTAWTLAKEYYPTHVTLARVAMEMVGLELTKIDSTIGGYRDMVSVRGDQPDPSFTGPF